MSGTPEAARLDLVRLLQGEPIINLRAQVPTADLPLRHSAVLVLFGALDEVLSKDHTSPVAPELDLLLLRRSDSMRHHAGEIAFPGGGVESADRDRHATALREAQEETGLDPAGVEVLGELAEIHLPVSNHLVTPVIGWWKRPSEVAADNTESTEVFRVPVAELLDPHARRTSVLRRGTHTHRGPAFVLGGQFGGHVVWGFTGILLSTLFDQLGWATPWDKSRETHISR